MVNMFKRLVEFFEDHYIASIYSFGVMVFSVGVGMSGGGVAGAAVAFGCGIVLLAGALGINNLES